MEENYEEEFHKIRDASILDPFVYDDIKCYCTYCEIKARDLTRMEPDMLSQFIDKILDEFRSTEDDETEEDEDE